MPVVRITDSYCHIRRTLWDRTGSVLVEFSIMNTTKSKQVLSHKLACVAASVVWVLPALCLGLSDRSFAQAAPAGTQSGAPRQSGTVKAATDHDFVLTDASGQDHAVTVPAGARVLIVPPGSKDLSAAAPGALTDLQPGDRVMVTGRAGEAGPGINAVRVLVMKGSAIAQSHAAEEAAWGAGVGGIVKSTDTAANTIVASHAGRAITIKTTPQTVFRRYAGGSVRFEDATRSSLAAIGPGDQLRARGSRSDESMFAADEVVTGSFRNYSGEISAVDATGNTVTLKDLATKKVVTVALSAQSSVRRLPPEIAARFAARERAGAGAGAGAQGTRGSGAAGAPGTAAPAPAGEASAMQRGPGGRPGESGGPGTPGGMGGGTRGGGDLSAMVGRLPTETFAGLKVGEAVMIVASSAEGPNSRPTAITLLAGVEPILAAAPAGEGMTLSPWSMGGGAEGESAGPQ